jgi:hypothetical protein
MKNIVSSLLCVFMGAVLGLISAVTLAPQEPDPAVLIRGDDMSRYPVDRFDTPKWCVDEISATTVMGGKMVALTLLTRDGKAEFHDYNVRLRNTERIHKCTKIFLPIGVAFGFLGA